MNLLPQLDPRFLLPLAVAALCAAHSPFAAASTLPALDALIHYQAKSVTRSGVTKETHYAERMVRRDGHVWVEPVRSTLPQAEPQPSAEGGTHGHQSFDFDDAARHVSRADNGQLRLDYVDAAKTTVVRVPPGEYQAMGFSGDWTTAISLFDPAQLQRMRPLKRKSAVAGTRWYEQRLSGRYSRVLWSEHLQVALVIESGTDDGSNLRRTTLSLQNPVTVSSRLPWQGLDRLAQHEYDDYLD